MRSGNRENEHTDRDNDNDNNGNSGSDAMKVLITGAAGHLGEALWRTLQHDHDVIGLDIKSSPYTDVVADVADATSIDSLMADVDLVYHTATLHKPHVETHTRQAFIDTNVSGTLTLLEAAVRNRVGAFVFTSTTSLYGDAMKPAAGEPAVWVTEDTVPVPKNIYGVSKQAAEELCHLFHRRFGLPCIVLRTSRFFPEEDDDAEKRATFTDANIKLNEFLFRRVEIEDVVSAHLLASARASSIGFGRYNISATTPFRPEDLPGLVSDPSSVVEARVPGFARAYETLGFRMFDEIGRVYVNDAARRDLGWQPKYDFERVLREFMATGDFRSSLAVAVGRKGYHDEVFEEGPYPAT